MLCCAPHARSRFHLAGNRSLGQTRKPDDNIQPAYNIILASDYTSQLCMLTFRRITFGHPEVSFSVDVKGVEHGAGTVEGMVQLPTPRCDPN
jgi:hypothetical protein